MVTRQQTAYCKLKIDIIFYLCRKSAAAVHVGR